MQPQKKPIATTTKKLFSRSTTVNVTIQAPPVVIWSLLTNVSAIRLGIAQSSALRGRYSRTVLSSSNRSWILNGPLRSRSKTSRSILGWSGATQWGTVLYILEDNGASGTRFTMMETIGGPLFPLFASQIPSFDTSFEQFTLDLKQVAEAGNTW